MNNIKITFINHITNDISIFVLKNYPYKNIYKELCHLFNNDNVNIISNFKNLVQNFIIDSDIFNQNIKNLIISLYDDYFLYEETNIKNQLINVKKYFLNKIKHKNCVDNFLEKAIDSNIYSINKFVEDLKERKYIRDNVEQYHQTSCYEQDFYQLIQIKDIINKIDILLNKEIEQLSDKYTKLN